MKKTRTALMGSVSVFVLEAEQTCEFVSKLDGTDKEKFLTFSLCGGFQIPIEWMSGPN